MRNAILLLVTLQLLAMLGEDACARESKLSSTIEKSCTLRVLYGFLKSGQVPTQASMLPCNDNEYVGKWLTVSFLCYWLITQS